MTILTSCIKNKDIVALYRTINGDLRTRIQAAIARLMQKVIQQFSSPFKPKILVFNGSLFLKLLLNKNICYFLRMYIS